ncbi:putative phage abortive infection protein [Flavobacterium sp.]|uniref:putative phage abortive infection protein n=1 Tax=Flavobacterium sp. TaxID=239 RepID=UPI003D0FA5EA
MGLILLIDTLRSQLNDSKINRELIQIQQFENTFYELLNLHNRNIEAIEFYDVFGYQKKGKLFFDSKKEELYNTFNASFSLSKNKRNAVSNFELIYNMHEEIFSTYFKTLYQLYKLIDKEDIPNKYKVKYSKILRAQLSNSELFFIRYNALSEIGDESIPYLNKYNYLKHLSNFELLEFKKWWIKLDKFEKNGLGHIFKDLKYLLKNIIDDRNTDTLEKIFKQSKYKIIIKSKEKFELEIKIIINNNINPQGKFLIDGLDKFSVKEIEILFKYVVREYLIYSNFNRFNVRRQLDIRSSINGNEITIQIEQFLKKRINFYNKSFT